MLLVPAAEDKQHCSRQSPSMENPYCQCLPVEKSKERLLSQDYMSDDQGINSISILAYSKYINIAYISILPFG